MHEYSIVQGIMQTVLAEAEKAKAQKVVKVSLKIGELTGVFPDSLTFCFELISKGTIAGGTALNIEKVPIMGYCPHCDKNFLIEDNHYLCQHCKNPTIELTSGRELQIDHLEVEDETD